MEHPAFDDFVVLLMHVGELPSGEAVAALPREPRGNLRFGRAIDYVMKMPSGERWRYDIRGNPHYVSTDEIIEIAETIEYQAWTAKNV